MDKIRIGKDITTTGSITVNGVAVCLEGLNLTAVAISKSDTMKEYPLELSVSGSSFAITWRGVDQIAFGDDGTIEYKVPVGKYIISLWQNRGAMYQTAWDVLAFQLVPHTFKENDEEDGLEVGHCDLGVIDFTNKYLIEIQSMLGDVEAAKATFAELNRSLGEYKTFFEDFKEAYERGDLNGKDLKFEDLTAEQKAELKGEKGEDGVSGGFLFPQIDYDPETGEMVIIGNKSEVQRFDYDEEENELIIKV